MKKITVLFATACLTLLPILGWATEPANLKVAKDAVSQYHDSGAYLKDIDAVIAKAKAQIDLAVAQNSGDIKHLALVLDIDETSLSNYDSMVTLSFGGSLAEITQYEDKGTDTAITPTLKLFQYAKDKGMSVFFITGRSDFEREITIRNLNAVGYSRWDGLILRSEEYKKASATDYKTAMRRKLIASGYHIVANIGDQQSDLTGGYADTTFKLPNPFYFIP